MKEVAYGPDLHLKARGAAALLEPGRRSGGDCCAGRGRTARLPPIGGTGGPARPWAGARSESRRPAWRRWWQVPRTAARSPAVAGQDPGDPFAGWARLAGEGGARKHAAADGGRGARRRAALVVELGEIGGQCRVLGP